MASHVVDALLARGDAVIVLDDLATGRPDNITPPARLVRVDIADAESLRRATDGLRCDAVVHAAAEASITRSVADPEKSARTNVGGTVHVLELATRAEAARFVFLSTGGALYGETPRCATEETRTVPVSPYGKQKLAAEELVRASGLSHAILRPSSVYGPRQRGDLESGVIAIFLERYGSGAELVVYGDGSAERDYLAVSDVAGATLAALDRREDGTWNLGTGVATSVNALLALLRDLLGEPRGGVRYAPARAGELQRSCVDASKAARNGLLSATIPLAEGLGRLVATPPGPRG